jgi:hypothetical protein
LAYIMISAGGNIYSTEEEEGDHMQVDEWQWPQ